MGKRGRDIEQVSEWLQKKGFSLIYEDSFRVSGRRRPDLLMPAILQGKHQGEVRKLEGYVAIECEHGDKHEEILNGIDDVVNQALDYFLGANYYIESRKKSKEEVLIIAFLLATPYSKDGALFKRDRQFQQVKIEGQWSARPMVFTQARILWRLALNIEHSIRAILSVGAKGRLKAKGLREFPLVGVIIEQDDNLIAMLNSSPWHWTLKPREHT